MDEFEQLLQAVADCGIDRALLAPGREGSAAPDVPASVASTYAVASGMDLGLWRQRYAGMVPELLPMGEFLNEAQSRERAAMSLENARYVGMDELWDPEWWPILTGSMQDAVAVHRETGEVWFSYNVADIKEVIAPSLEAYWLACARWVENFTFDIATGLWEPTESYRGCEGPWDPNELGTGFTTTLFRSVDQ